ncbi:heavy metal-responsive transcriptional regulator [Arthrobacter sp. H5]|uniref:heavy metal-responsive transcriptional regulator n=1 Tax=Arthrobacter sp. H5 TaxID=1267973 RepID=UPI0004829599|nr:heavy metal-responsive transcriptional regulator [Arthrobacter sp. H5]
MKIGELARSAGVNAKTVRYYESIGILPQPARTASGYRDYDGSYVDRLAFIRSSQRLGLTLDEVKEVLAFRERGELPCAYVHALLNTQLDSIDRRIEELEELRIQLKEIVSGTDLASQADDNLTCRLIEHSR